MQTAFIRFVAGEDRVRGFATMAKSSRISSFPGQVYQVPVLALQLLATLGIQFRTAKDDEVRAARKPNSRHLTAQ